MITVQPSRRKGCSSPGLSPDNRLVEIAEIKDHPFMLGTQFHPEFLSRPTRAHPLFKAFIGAVKNSHSRSLVPVKQRNFGIILTH